MKKEITFYKKVYKVVKNIPTGRVSTYGLIAKYLGAPKSSRVVGYAMNVSHKIHDVPAHRVVNRIGLLTGKHHFSGSNMMKELLESEGVKVKNNIIIDFKNVIWDPSIELD